MHKTYLCIIGIVLNKVNFFKESTDKFCNRQVFLFARFYGLPNCDPVSMTCDSVSMTFDPVSMTYDHVSMTCDPVSVVVVVSYLSCFYDL